MHVQNMSVFLSPWLNMLSMLTGGSVDPRSANFVLGLHGEAAEDQRLRAEDQRQRAEDQRLREEDQRLRAEDQRLRAEH